MYSCNPNSDPARLGKGLGLGLGLGFRVEGIPSFSMNHTLNLNYGKIQL